MNVNENDAKIAKSEEIEELRLALVQARDAIVQFVDEVGYGPEYDLPCEWRELLPR